ncbi:uncharacterized protein LOC116196868 [Punica granatum]|uniref:J domain-containing protein n=2 Tax=Punica granatum TaxID=22663 RepID=A0A218VUV5_PUNGR|nr:uncharacterized protein LOC116196868 [Punica granatum]OWM64176.1 hypothetical protein CDL15_Pgr018747 [Punica granatum]PKI44331.1 hypothetical protein CRG98_035287 [Punica granatum]
MAEPDPEQEALRLKSLAEAEFKSSNFKSALKHAKATRRLFPSLPGLSEMITCFKILAAASVSSDSGMPDYYGILQVEPFSHINSIRKQYKSLALTIHPDKNPSLGSAEAFKVVGDAFRVLTDSIRRKEYDMKLRIRMQEEAVAVGDDLVERFWTACWWCKILHQFEKKYLGHILVCPSCRKSFKAVEIGDNDDDDDDDDDDHWDEAEESSERQVGKAKSKQKAIPVDESERKRKIGSIDNSARENVELDSLRLRKRVSRSKIGDEAEKAINKNKARVEDEMMTLAEMQLEAKRKMNREKIRLRGKEQEKGLEKEVAAEMTSRKIDPLDTEARQSSQIFETTTCSNPEKTKPIQVYKRGIWRRKTAEDGEIERAKRSKGRNVELMLVEDSDFYDFDKDRSERRFKKGQVWATYDDVDGMPRNYCLIDEVVPLNPFMLRVSWLDLQGTVWQPQVETASTLACGQFKVAQKTTLKSVKPFSHVVDCERAARELYRIFPKKGSVWALFKGSCSYDIVIFLTTYSEVFGLSMAYLERVDGFKTVFRRREIGPHAVRWLDKSKLGVCSHQIPARKLEGNEVSNLLKDCWELDPASLPPDLLMIPMKR